MLYDGKDNGEAESDGVCWILDRVAGDASLMRVLEQSCKGVSHAGLLGSECRTGRKQQVQRPEVRACLEWMRGVRKIGILMTKIKITALLVVITSQFSLY